MANDGERADEEDGGDDERYERGERERSQAEIAQPEHQRDRSGGKKRHHRDECCCDRAQILAQQPRARTCRTCGEQLLYADTAVAREAVSQEQARAEREERVGEERPGDHQIAMWRAELLEIGN